MPALRPSSPELELARRERRSVRRSLRPLARAIRALRQEVQAGPRVYVGRVTSVAPLTVVIRPGDEGEWTVPGSPAVARSYTPGLTDWVLVLDIGRSPKFDPSHGSFVILDALNLGS